MTNSSPPEISEDFLDDVRHADARAQVAGLVRLDGVEEESDCLAKSSGNRDRTSISCSGCCCYGWL